MSHPYTDLPATAFWRSAVADVGAAGLQALWQPRWPLSAADPVATLGSCFARHIGRALVAQGWHWIDAEPAPRALTPAQAEAHGYGMFSARVGNVYTAAQLRQWVDWAFGERAPPPALWWRDGRVYDPYRPGIEPGGLADARELTALRAATLLALRRALVDARLLVFTLGLVEGWEDRVDGVVYPLAPGVVAGEHDPDRHAWRLWRHAEVVEDLLAVLTLVQRFNPALRLLLTVSPVPLTATLTGRHVLVASTEAKATLRSAAAELVASHPDVDYFPSYEIVATHPSRGAHYDANLRTVSAAGVAEVMRHFFAPFGAGPAPQAVAPVPPPKAMEAGPPDDHGDEHCDELLLDAFRPRGQD